MSGWYLRSFKILPIAQIFHFIDTWIFPKCPIPSSRRLKRQGYPVALARGAVARAKLIKITHKMYTIYSYYVYGPLYLHLHIVMKDTQKKQKICIQIFKHSLSRIDLLGDLGLINRCLEIRKYYYNVIQY